jgi:hypothetical protein
MILQRRVVTHLSAQHNALDEDYEEKKDELPRGYGGRQSLKLPIANVDDQDSPDEDSEAVSIICMNLL